MTDAVAVPALFSNVRSLRVLELSCKLEILYLNLREEVRLLFLVKFQQVCSSRLLRRGVLPKTRGCGHVVDA